MMKKLEKFESFRNENNVLETSQSILIFGGISSGETNNWCFTLNDTCEKESSDVRHIRERDGVVESDITTLT
jgi:hypothetical protein